MSPPTRRVGELDGLRGLACALILLRHWVYLEIPAGTKGIWGMIGILLSQTWSGVDLFFVLSGFLIFSKLLREKGQGGWGARFAVDRVFRLGPLYVVMLGAYFGLRTLQVASPFWTVLFQDRLPAWVYPVFAQGWYTGVCSCSDSEFLSVTWSLAAEVEFYILAAVLVSLVLRRQLVASLVSCLLFCWLLRFTLYIYNPNAFLLVYLIPPARMDGFILGGLVAWLFSGDGKLRMAGINPDVVALPLAILGLGVAVLTFNRVPLSGTFAATVSYGWYAMFYAAAVLYVVLVSRAGEVRWLRSGILPRLGEISYGVYLFHLPVHYILNAVWGNSDAYVTTSRGLVGLGAETVVTFLLAWASWRFLEHPLIGLGKRLALGLGRRGPAPAAAT